MKTVLILGCDGYIGHPLTLRLLAQGYKVIGVDNGLRRQNVEKMNSFSAIPIESIKERTQKHKTLGRYNFGFLNVASTNNSDISFLIKNYKPSTIINLAHQPSGPFSMSSYETCRDTTWNNLQGTLNLLWAIKENCPNCHYITIGSTGEYDHNLNIDIEEGVFRFEHNGRMSGECIYPRRPTSFYHTSKVASTYYIDGAARWWNIKSTDIQQSIVFGAFTPEIEEFNSPTRLDSDEAFGTVLNRFIVQAVLEHPLTVYA
jgi:nucleoside-diphosphate-sugar epimerase